MLGLPPMWLCAWLLAVTATAAVVDARTGLIPNWLTLSTLLAAPFARAATDGPTAFCVTLASAALCGAAPLLMFCARAMGGGDVKLFAAVGALCGVRLGLEVQFASYALSIAYACCALCRRGQLVAALRNAGRVATAKLARKRVPAPESTTSIRLGPSILLASALVLARTALQAAP